MSAASFLPSSFLQAINAVMLWPVHVQKVPQASEHLCLAKLQIRCEICCACQSVCPVILTDSSVSRTVDPQKSLQPKTAWLCASRGSPFQLAVHQDLFCDLSVGRSVSTVAMEAEESVHSLQEDFRIPACSVSAHISWV